jgi:N-acetylmuramoyl-L-alanine amidase
MKAIFIESGHGKGLIFRDVGAVGRHFGKVYHERDLVVTIGRKVIEILKSKTELKKVLIQGVGVETEANTSAKMKFVNSVMSENKFNPSECIGVSIHMNSYSSIVPTGFEVWAQRNGKSKPLAEKLALAWDKYKITPMRRPAVKNSKDSRFGKFYIDDTLCPFVIIETSFISNPSDVKAITGNYDRVAEAIAHGILNHIRSL